MKWHSLKNLDLLELVLKKSPCCCCGLSYVWHLSWISKKNFGPATPGIWWRILLKDKMHPRCCRCDSSVAFFHSNNPSYSKQHVTAQRRQNSFETFQNSRSLLWMDNNWPCFKQNWMKSHKMLFCFKPMPSNCKGFW